MNIEVERYELREGPLYVFEPDRRDFLLSLGAGIVFVAYAAGQERGTANEARLHVGENGRYTVLTGKIEEGQGARAEIAMAAAEELGVPANRVDVVMADTSVTPNDGITAGSGTTPRTIPLIRQAAAAAKQAAITPNSEWDVMGKSYTRPNGSQLVTGEHKYPSDVSRPGMLYGSVLRPPSYGAKLTSLKTTEIAGVTVVHDGDFVGCAAKSSFEARRAIETLAAAAQWTEKAHPSSDVLYEHFRKNAQSPSSGGRNRPHIRGDVENALAGAKQKLRGTFETAYIAHAPMEPRAAVAEWEDGKLNVWTGTSNPFSVREELAKTFRIPSEKVRVIVPDFGGGFGGKHTGEAAIEAARLAQAAKRPVSLRWTRGEEFAHAYFRPAALIEVEAALDEKGSILAWDFANYNSGGSAIESPYRSENARIRFLATDSPLRQGSYRALASTANNFARESFIDELAQAAGTDPLAFRLAHLENDRIREVLLAATRKFGWEVRSKAKRTNRGVGLACGTEKNSVVAACVEVEVDPKSGTPKLLEICEAYECGAIVNPDGLRQQVEGAILMGLGGALREEILFEGGKLSNGKFAGYKVPRFRDVPEIDIVLVDKREADPVGAGETPIIAVAPAMANAIFAATGERVRTMPFRLKSAENNGGRSTGV